MNDIMGKLQLWINKNSDKNYTDPQGNTRKLGTITYRDITLDCLVEGRPLSDWVYEIENCENKLFASEGEKEQVPTPYVQSAFHKHEMEQAYRKGREDALKELESQPKFPRKMVVWSNFGDQDKRVATVVHMFKDGSVITENEYGNLLGFYPYAEEMLTDRSERFCDHCGAQLGEKACGSQYTDGNYCSAKCSDQADKKYLEEHSRKMRPMTHAEVFKAIRDGAVVRHFRDPNFRAEVTNYWTAFKNISIYEICYNYTGTDSDVWQKMEVEE